MIDDFEKIFKEKRRKSMIELKKIEQRIKNHIDGNGNNILKTYPFFVELKTPFEKYDRNDSFIDWLEENINIEKYIRPWPNLVYFKDGEDATAFKLRWI